MPVCIGIGRVDCAGLGGAIGNPVGQCLLYCTADRAAQLPRAVGRHLIPCQRLGGCGSMAQESRWYCWTLLCLVWTVSQFWMK